MQPVQLVQDEQIRESCTAMEFCRSSVHLEPTCYQLKSLDCMSCPHPTLWSPKALYLLWDQAPRHSIKQSWSACKTTKNFLQRKALTGIPLWLLELLQSELAKNVGRTSGFEFFQTTV